MVMERILKEVVFQSYGNQESSSQAYGENSIHGIVSESLSITASSFYSRDPTHVSIREHPT